MSKEYELTQAETSFAELSQEEQRKRSQEWAMLLAMAAMPTIDTALYGKSGTIYGNNVYDNLESQGTQDIYKGSTTSWKPPQVDTSTGVGYNGNSESALANQTLEGGKLDIRSPLPNIEEAIINPAKVTEYALNTQHPVGGNKAKVFESALGYNQSNAGELINQICRKLSQGEAVLGKVDVYGKRYTVDLLITGPNGKTATVRTGWILRPNSTKPELITLYVK